MDLWPRNQLSDVFLSKDGGNFRRQKKLFQDHPGNKYWWIRVPLWVSTLRWIPTHLTRNQNNFFYFSSPKVQISKQFDAWHSFQIPFLQHKVCNLSCHEGTVEFVYILRLVTVIVEEDQINTLTCSPGAFIRQ